MQQHTTARPRRQTREEQTESRRVYAETVCAALAAGLAGKIPLPPGHDLQLDVRHETTWLLGGPSTSVSAYVRHSPMDFAEPQQIHAEFRVFLDTPRACLWVNKGPQFAGQSVDLLAGSNRHLRAESYEALVEACAETYRTAVATV